MASNFELGSQFAWRCNTTGGGFYDPCFAPPGQSNVTTVACTYSPWSPVDLMTLSQPLGCPKRKTSAATAPKRVRRLWGNGKGAFRTRGRYASATVRGTIWLTEDRCTTTLIRVRSGRVDVFDLVRRRHVTVRAGQSYVARTR